MHRFAVLAALALAGCTAPSPYFHGARIGMVETGGMRFTIYRRADEVELHRKGGGIPRERDVFLGAIEAIRIATGCTVRPRSMKGDQAIVTAEIDCPV